MTLMNPEFICANGGGEMNPVISKIVTETVRAAIIQDSGLPVLVDKLMAERDRYRELLENLERDLDPAYLLASELFNVEGEMRRLQQLVREALEPRQDSSSEVE